MGRRPTFEPICVLMNNREVGALGRSAGGNFWFQYGAAWLNWEHAIPVSLSLPLREAVYRGPKVQAVFDGLLPSSVATRDAIARELGLADSEPLDLLREIGADCSGALQFSAIGDANIKDVGAGQGASFAAGELKGILNDLDHCPLGAGREGGVRVSLPGTRSKIALTRFDGKILKPNGSCPSTHILKVPDQTRSQGAKVDHSLENELFCAAVMEDCRLSVTKGRLMTIDQFNVLMIERFDRQKTPDGRVIRLPMEHVGQALGVGDVDGVGVSDILKLLGGSDFPIEDQENFFKTALLFYLLGVTSATVRKINVFLYPGGGFRLAPLCGVRSDQPLLDTDANSSERMKFAMPVGREGEVRFNHIEGRHFIESAVLGGMSKVRATALMNAVFGGLDRAFVRAAQCIPSGLSMNAFDNVKKAALMRRVALRR